MARRALTGDKELIRALARIPNTVNASLDPIAKASLEPMRAASERNARMRRQPGGTPKGGHLDQGIVVQKRSGGNSKVRVFWISMKNRARSIAHLVEFGTAPHYQPRRGIMHPGARAFPFMSPAFEAEKNNVVSTFGKMTWDAISNAVQRVGGRK